MEKWRTFWYGRPSLATRCSTRLMLKAVVVVRAPPTHRPHLTSPRVSSTRECAYPFFSSLNTVLPSKKFLRKILGQDGQDLAQETKILPKRPRSCPRGQILPRILPKFLGKILGKILAAIILASWTRSWASLGKRWQVLGKSWASCLAQELFAGLFSEPTHKVSAHAIDT